MAFLMQRAKAVDILRRVPIHNYDVSFLVTSFLCQLYNKQKPTDHDSVCHFVEDINAGIHELKLLVNTRGRAVAAQYLKTLTL